MTKLTYIRGDDKEIPIAITDGDGEPVDITGWTVFLTVKKTLADADEDALIAKTVTDHTDPTAGLTAIAIDEEDTEDADAGRYYYDIQLKDSDGKIHSAPRADFVLNADVTLRTS